MYPYQQTIDVQNILIPHLYFPKPQKTITPDCEKRIFINRATNQKDLAKVFDVRWKGYQKYCKRKSEIIDEYDFKPNATILLAEDENQNPIGTIRILDRRYGSIELDEFIDVDSILSRDERACVEPTRFSIPYHPQSKLIKMLLFKSVLLYCQENHINTIINSVRPSAARAYRFLLFEDVGLSGIYRHPLLGNLEHYTYKLNIAEKSEILRRINPKTHSFFYEADNSNIDEGSLPFAIFQRMAA